MKNHRYTMLRLTMTACSVMVLVEALGAARRF